MLNTDAEIKNRFQTLIQEKNLFHKEDLLIIAVSGGVDSVVLAHLCHQLNYNIIITHCNFQLRGSESQRDQEFVEQLAQQIGVRCEVKIFDTETYIQENKLSVQEGARELRYQWFHGLADQYEKETKGKVYILTAHHADDQIETLMMHFFRGTGLKGLTGIPEKNGRIVRPLLPFFKTELLEYAKAVQLSFVEDSSNRSSDYTRNFFRNEVLPLIEKVYPAVRENLLDNICRFQSVNDLYEFATKPILKKIAEKRGEELYISIGSLFRFNNDTLIYDLLSPYGFTESQMAEVIKLKDSESGGYIVAPQTNNRLIKYRNHFIVAPPQNNDTLIYNWDKKDNEIEYIGGKLIAQSFTHKPEMNTNADIALLDAKEISYPLIIRRWKEGDYFYPLGMRKKKKIARFMIDQKFSKTQKENTWVLESASRIVWVIGHRIDDRFKITDKTKEVLQIERRMA
jgi:tRNA(Ile)-lysidine synthase